MGLDPIGAKLGLEVADSSFTLGLKEVPLKALLGGCQALDILHDSGQRSYLKVIRVAIEHLTH